MHSRLRLISSASSLACGPGGVFLAQPVADALEMASVSAMGDSDLIGSMDESGYAMSATLVETAGSESESFLEMQPGGYFPAKLRRQAATRDNFVRQRNNFKFKPKNSVQENGAMETPSHIPGLEYIDLTAPEHQKKKKVLVVIDFQVDYKMVQNIKPEEIRETENNIIKLQQMKGVFDNHLYTYDYMPADGTWQAVVAGTQGAEYPNSLQKNMPKNAMHWYKDTDDWMGTKQYGDIFQKDDNLKLHAGTPPCHGIAANMLYGLDLENLPGKAPEHGWLLSSSPLLQQCWKTIQEYLPEGNTCKTATEVMDLAVCKKQIHDQNTVKYEEDRQSGKLEYKLQMENNNQGPYGKFQKDNLKSRWNDSAKFEGSGLRLTELLEANGYKPSDTHLFVVGTQFNRCVMKGSIHAAVEYGFETTILANATMGGGKNNWNISNCNVGPRDDGGKLIVPPYEQPLKGGHSQLVKEGWRSTKQCGEDGFWQEAQWPNFVAPGTMCVSSEHVGNFCNVEEDKAWAKLVYDSRRGGPAIPHAAQYLESAGVTIHLALLKQPTLVRPGMQNAEDILLWNK